MTRELIQLLKENTFLLVYVAVLAIALIKYRYYYETRLKALPILLAFILLTEIFGGIIRSIDEMQIIFEDGYQNHNHLIFNILDIVFFLYFFRIYTASTTNAKLKRFSTWGTIIYCLVSVINPFIENFILKPQLLATLTGSASMVILSYKYLKETKNMRVSFSNYHKLLQWISTGLLIFFPFYPIILAIGQLNEALYSSLQLRQLLLLLIILLYGCFIIGFSRLGKISTNKQKKPSN